MFALIAAALLAAFSPDHSDEDVVTDKDMVDWASTEISNWNSCVQGKVRETVIGQSAVGTSAAGNEAKAGFLACTIQENAVRAKLLARLNNDPASAEWAAEIMTQIRKVIDQRALRTAVIIKIDFSQIRTCRSLSYSGGVPAELAETCRRYGIR